MTGVQPGDPRDLAPQYVLPLVVRVERAEPPARTDALEAAALAVLTFLTDPRATGAYPDGAGKPSTDGAGESSPDGAGESSAEGAGESAGAHPDGAGEPSPDGAAEPGPDRAGEWAPAVLAWADARIRKVVRRARGAEWRRAEALDGITVTHGSAEVRVFPPVPLDGWPRDLARLQVSGTDLDDPDPPAPPPPPGVPVLWLNPAVELTAGKAMAQVGHAAQLGLAALAPDVAAAWRQDGFPIAVRVADRTAWAALLDRDLPVVRDAGFTEVAPGTCTAVADLGILGA